MKYRPTFSPFSKYIVILTVFCQKRQNDDIFLFILLFRNDSNQGYQQIRQPKELQGSENSQAELKMAGTSISYIHL